MLDCSGATVKEIVPKRTFRSHMTGNSLHQDAYEIDPA